jgi:hypothetical protein
MSCLYVHRPRCCKHYSTDCLPSRPASLLQRNFSRSQETTQRDKCASHLVTSADHKRLREATRAHHFSWLQQIKRGHATRQVRLTSRDFCRSQETTRSHKCASLLVTSADQKRPRDATSVPHFSWLQQITETTRRDKCALLPVTSADLRDHATRQVCLTSRDFSRLQEATRSDRSASLLVTSADHRDHATRQLCLTSRNFSRSQRPRDATSAPPEHHSGGL